MEHSEDFPDSFYRVSVKGLFVKDGKVFLLHEPPELSGGWEMPGGGLDFGEDIHLGLKREVEEETGIKVTKVSDKPVYIWSYKYENRRKMDWYYSLVIAYRIDLESTNFTPTKECQAVDFFSQDQLQSLELAGQAKKLAEIFNPADFVRDF